MSFYKEMGIGNYARILTEEDGGFSLADMIFAYILWFYFDHRLDEGEDGGGWFGELFVETDDSQPVSAETLQDKVVVLVLFRRNKKGQDKIADCLSMPARFLNSKSLSRVLDDAQSIDEDVFVPTFVLEDGRTMATLWQELFLIANDYFADPEDPKLVAFEEILVDILDPGVIPGVMEELRKNLKNFKWGEVK